MERPLENAFSLAGGILVSNYFVPQLYALLYVVGIGLCLWRVPKGRLRMLSLAALVGAAVMSSSAANQLRAEFRHRAALDDRQTEELRGVVDGPLETQPGLQRFVFVTDEERIWLTVYDGGGSRPGSPRGRAREKLVPGQHLLAQLRLRRPIGLRGLGAGNRRAQVMARGAELVGSARRSDIQVTHSEFSMWKLPMAMRAYAISAVARQSGGADGRAIVVALTTGDRSSMSIELSSAIRAAGLAHLLAVSGMHMAAVITLMYFLVGALWSMLPWRQVLEPRAVAAGAALVAAAMFTALTGARPSTCRAFLVATLVLIGVMTDHRISPMSALAWAASALLVWRPVLLWDVGFQMSFAATFALAYVFGRRDDILTFAVPSRHRRYLSAMWSIARASFWASFATLPFALYHFGEVSPWALVANVLAVPLVTLVLLPLSIVGAFLSCASSALGDLVLGLATALAEVLAHVCYALERVLPMHARAPLDGLEFGLWAFLGVALLTGHRLRPRVRWSLVALLAGLLAWSRTGGSGGHSAVRITFVEIGQGDAAVIELPGEVWLVDGGGLPFVAPTARGDRQYLAEAPARQALLPYLRHRRIRSIDLAIVSHPHPDHYVGLQAVAREIPIRELWSAHPQANGPYERWLAELRESGTQVRAPALGVSRRSGAAGLEVLWPRYYEDGSGHGPVAPDPILSVNDNSLVVRLHAHGRRILFAGDVEEEAEELMVEIYGDGLRSDIVKVPHHGSRTSSTERFVWATQPQVAVVSCGRANRFDFPADSVVRRWSLVAEVLRTDLVGSVTVQIEASGRMWLDTVDPF